jgi:hypothetical protein
MKSKKYFFILGLPRSRTAWFANLFTTDKTHCFHEIGLFYDDENLLRILASVEKEYVGISEPNPQLYFRITELYPDSPIVLISRRTVDATESFLKAFNITDRDEKRIFCNLMFRYHHYINRIIEENRAMVKQYTDLNDDEIADIWRYCIPGINPDLLRIKQLQEFNVQIAMKNINEFFGIFKNRKEFIKETLQCQL